MAHDMTVEVVVLNYNSQPVADIVVQGNYIGGYYGGYGPGGTGGKIYCCVKVKPGVASVQWMYGGAEGEPMAGDHDKASNVIPVPHDDYKYLGVHLYPDSHA